MDDSPENMSQVAPYPNTLTTLVQRLRYKDGWRFNLTHLDRGQGSRGLMQVRVLVDQCDTCGALLLGDSLTRHLAWHLLVDPERRS